MEHSRERAAGGEPARALPCRHRPTRPASSDVLRPSRECRGMATIRYKMDHLLEIGPSELVAFA
jgi:hypothetical protein